jgi:hypothetical protein
MPIPATAPALSKAGRKYWRYVTSLTPVLSMSQDCSGGRDSRFVDIIGGASFSLDSGRVSELRREASSLDRWAARVGENNIAVLPVMMIMMEVMYSEC